MLEIARPFLRTRVLSIRSMSLYTLAVLAASRAHAGLPCISNVFLDYSTTPASAHLICLNDGCAISCSTVQESTPFGMGTTCACYPNTVPRCCHLVLVPDGGDWWVVPQGQCSAQNENCQSGTSCTVQILMGEDYDDCTPKCLGGT